MIARGQVHHQRRDRNGSPFHPAAQRNHETVVPKIAKIPGYQKQFRAVFGAGVSLQGIADAIAAFERTIVSANSAFDKYTMMHDLKLERFGAEADGPIKTFVLRGIKDSPPYLHDGRLLTLEDTVEFFNVVSGTQLNREEKAALVAFMRAL